MSVEIRASRLSWWCDAVPTGAFAVVLSFACRFSYTFGINLRLSSELFQKAPMSKLFQSTVAVLCAVSLGVSASRAQEQKAAAPGIQPAAVSKKMSDEEFVKKVSYLLAYNQIAQMNNDLKQGGIILDREQVIAGVEKALAGEPVGMEMDKIRPVMDELQSRMSKAQAQQDREMQAKQDAMMAEMKVKADQNAATGAAFLADNAKKAGVQTLDGGVQYEVLVKGTGRKPNPSDGVKINYHGMTVDGKVFDSSIEEIRGKKPAPIDHVANGFVDGFNTAIQAMPIGSKWKVVIPHDEAYGLRGPMGPNQTLIFEIELLDAWEKPSAPGTE